MADMSRLKWFAGVFFVPFVVFALTLTLLTSCGKEEEKSSDTTPFGEEIDEVEKVRKQVMGE